jgi:cobalt-zinc-cadmium efflux system membrane fusion protein
MTTRSTMKSRPLSVLFAALCALPACQKSVHAAPTETPARDPSAVALPSPERQLESLRIAPAAQCEALPLRLNGRLTWDEDVTARVFTPFAGRVARIVANTGDTVAAGASLAAITSPEYGVAQAEARKACTDLAEAERTVARLHDLFEHGAVPEKDLRAAEACCARATAEQQRTAMQLAFHGGCSDTIDQNYRLRAPIAGVVVEKNVGTGQEVRADQMLANVAQLSAPLFVISDPHRLWVQLDATEADLPRLRPGLAFTVRLPGDRTRSYEGRVLHVADAVDPVSRMVRVRGAVENSDGMLKAEMFVGAELPEPDAKCVQVASSAVFLSGERHFLYVDCGEGRFMRRPVKVGGQDGDRLVVLDGVRAGERVVVDGSLLLEQLFKSGS